jgi:hypothetical protein
VAIRHFQGRVEIDAAFGDDVRDRRQAGLADVQKRDNLGMAMRQDMARETLEGGAPGTARVNDRGNACVHAGDIGIHAEAGESFEDVSVKIDQTRRHDETLCVDHAPRLFIGNARRDSRDHALLDRNIVNAAQTLRRVNQRAAL